MIVFLSGMQLISFIVLLDVKVCVAEFMSVCPCSKVN